MFTLHPRSTMLSELANERLLVTVFLLLEMALVLRIFVPCQLNLGGDFNPQFEQGNQIMSPTMMTRSAGRPAAASRRGGTGGRAGRGGGRTRGRSSNQGDGRIDGQGDQGRGQGNGRNQNGDAVNDNIQGDVSKGCTHKEFLACNPKE
ncbi:hypothetical protein Tco_0386877 [Tanacetum coccineum]